MKRFVLFIILFSLLTLSAAWLANAGTAILVKDSKHNLSTSGTGSIKSVTTLGGTTEICVFCHTPHSGNTAAPLWNKTSSVQSYDTYTSDVLAGLVYPGAENPNSHVKTKICLSCHDGTIALGSLVNLPYGVSTQIPMQGTAGADVTYGMPKTAAGYIGLNLKDDHPVAIKHDSLIDTELVNGGAVGAAVRLYTAAGNNVNANGNYVECTSCHEPHNNEFGNFLVESNDGSALCIQCHAYKAGFVNSIHNLAGTGYNPTNGRTIPPTTLGTTVGGVKCMNCHFPHKAGLAVGSTSPNTGYGTYLLSFREENSCFNNPTDRWGTLGALSSCHGAGGAKNIETDLTAQYKHPVKDSNPAPRHKATEAQSAGWFGDANVQHTECEDCHNPHTSGGTAHNSPVGSLTVDPPLLMDSSPIYGVGGVNVTFPGVNWGIPTPATAYTYVKPIGVTETASTGADIEYKICFKCHTAYAWTGGTVPISTSLSAAMTDQAQEFNPNNTSFHPVAKGNTLHTAGSTGLTGGWTNGDTQTMYCSDCHTRSGGGTPKGAHGSSQHFILAGVFEDSYGTAGGAQHQSTSGLCSRCHLDSVYSTPTLSVVLATNTDTNFRNGSNHNLHNQHRYKAANIANKREYRCVNCHVRIPHGWKRDALIVQYGDGAPYEAGGASTGLITSWTQQPGAYTITSCGSGVANGVTGCHP